MTTRTRTQSRGLDDGRAVPFFYTLHDYTVKRIAYDTWDIIHAGAIVATVNHDTAMRFICGTIDPLTLGSDATSTAAA